MRIAAQGPLDGSKYLGPFSPCLARVFHKLPVYVRFISFCLYEAAVVVECHLRIVIKFEKSVAHLCCRAPAVPLMSEVSRKTVGNALVRADDRKCGKRKEDGCFDEGGETQQPLICVYIEGSTEASGVLGEFGTLATRE